MNKAFLERERAQFIENYIVFNKVEPLVLLPGLNGMTLKMAADYFETTVDEITYYASLSSLRDEFLSDGLCEYSADEIKEQLKLAAPGCVCESKDISISCYHDNRITFIIEDSIVFTKQAMLRMAMILPDNEIASQIRGLLISGTASLSSNNEPMKRMKIRVGDTIGKVKIVEDMGLTNSRHHKYLCECVDCGAQFIRDVKTIKAARADICYDCASKRETEHQSSVYKDKTGKIIGGYRILHPTGRRSSSRNLIWNCQCLDCGQIREVASNRLTEKYMPICPCKRRKTVPEELPLTPDTMLEQFKAELTAYNARIRELREEHAVLTQRYEMATNTSNIY